MESMEKREQTKIYNYVRTLVKIRQNRILTYCWWVKRTGTKGVFQIMVVKLKK